MQKKIHSYLLLALIMITLPNCSDQKISDESVMLANEDILRVNEGVVNDIEMMKGDLVKSKRRLVIQGAGLKAIDFRIEQINRITNLCNETINSLVYSFLSAAGVEDNDFDQYITYLDTNKTIVGIKLSKETIKSSSKKQLNVRELSFSCLSEEDCDIEELLMSLRDSIIKGILFHPPHYLKYERPSNLYQLDKYRHSIFFHETVKPFFYELYFDEKDINYDTNYYQNYDVLAQLKDLSKQYYFSDNVIRLNRLLLTLRKLQNNIVYNLSDNGSGGFSFYRITYRAKPRYSATENTIELITVDDIKYNLLRYSIDPTLPKSDWKIVHYEEFKNSIVFDTIFDSPTVIYLDALWTTNSQKDSIWLEMTDTIGPKQFQTAYE